MSPQETGILFTNCLPEYRSLTNTILPNGSGVAAGDIDGDGLCDLFFCGLGGRSRLYRNLGSWRFQDVTDQSGIVCSNLDVTGAVFADIDGNGSSDLLFNSIGGGTFIFFNDGKGHFAKGTQVLNPGRGGTSLAMADTDGDGRLDLYIANYRAATIMDAPGTRFTMNVVNGQPQVASINGKPLTDPEWTNRFNFKFGRDSQGRGTFGREELGEPDLFCLNDGHGHFQPVPWTSGRFLDETGKPLESPPFDWGLSVSFRDLNGDGFPDLYICNDFLSPDRCWLNDGQGHFRAAPKHAFAESSLSSMGVDVADVNGDGFDDILVVDMLGREQHRRLTQRNAMQAEAMQAAMLQRPQYPRNTLFLNRGDGTYAEIAQLTGLEATDWSWAPIFLDVDLDGYQDLLIPNGFVRDNMNLDIQARIREQMPRNKVRSADELALRKLFPPLATPNLAFKNMGNLRFQELGRDWGFNATTISQGTCLADLDNDGDLDVIANNLNSVAGLYRNDCPAPRIAVQLRGLAGNTQGIGARIQLRDGSANQSQVVTCGGRYLSSDQPIRTFAAPPSTTNASLLVTWRSGRQSIVTNVQPGFLYEVSESGAAQPANAGPKMKTAFAFEDYSSRLKHRHQDEPFDDFARQPLLPKKLSQLGPGIGWWDVDSDGIDDLLVAAGKGGSLACFRSDGKGNFGPMALTAVSNSVVARDQTSIAGWHTGQLLIGSANYEDGSSNGSCVEVFGMQLPKVIGLVASDASSAGPLAVADYNGDGELDLFIGGRVKAGEYPLPATSRLFLGHQGTLALDSQNSALFCEIGLVSGATWSDLDGDGWPELILACEWGPLKIFRNNHGRLQPWNPPVLAVGGHSVDRAKKLQDLTGWWNGIATGDFDGDGRLDLVASNWGENSRYERFREKPLQIRYGDFNGDGTTQLLECHFDSLFGKYVSDRMLGIAAKGMPWVSGRYPTHLAWAETGVDEILANAPGQTKVAEATWLESTVFLNRGDHFEVRTLPVEAQFAPAFGICVADFNGDGREDIFLAQNFFGVEGETSRYAAGRGLLLYGDGQGSFRAVPGQESGIRIYGEQRGAAVCDFDGDGRVDLAVAQNSEETRLFHNLGAKPGLRVRLRGPAGNPRGIGASVRLRCADQFGPVREIKAGSGYWSQDSPVLVFGGVREPAKVWVRWPGGRTTQTPVPAGAREVEIPVSP